MSARVCSCGLPMFPIKLQPDGTITRACWACDLGAMWPRTSGTVILTDRPARPYDHEIDGI